MADMGAPLDRVREVESSEPFTPQSPRLLKIELSRDVGDGAQRVEGRLPGRRPIDFGMQRKRPINLKRRIEAAG